MWRAARRLGSLSVRSGVGVRSISSVTATKLFASLRAPIIAAPMFIVSNPDLVIAQCKVRAVACARPVQWPVHGLCLARAWHACYALLHMQHAHMHVHAPVLRSCACCARSCHTPTMPAIGMHAGGHHRLLPGAQRAAAAGACL